MARELPGDDHQVVHQTQGLIGGGAHRGATVATRWPVRAVHEVDLHLTDRTWDYSCGAVIAPVDAPVGRLVVGSHGNSWAWWAERERELQAVAVVRRIEELVAEAPAHVVLGGDFNAEPHTSSMRFFTGRTSLEGISTAYGDAWEAIRGDEPGHTLDPRNPLREIDEPGETRGRPDAADRRRRARGARAGRRRAAQRPLRRLRRSGPARACDAGHLRRRESRRPLIRWHVPWAA